MIFRPLSSPGVTDSPSGPILAARLSAGSWAGWGPQMRTLAALVFSATWMAQGWQESGHLLGPTRLNHLAQDLWKLLLILTCCYGIHWFFRHRGKNLGLVLGLAVAVASMAVHSG